LWKQGDAVPKVPGQHAGKVQQAIGRPTVFGEACNDLLGRTGENDLRDVGRALQRAGEQDLSLHERGVRRSSV
jgi:hypothetical protein